MSDLEKRASDAEREQAVARLREASVQGRLTFEELADRTALAYRARTQAELEGLTDDLPAALPAPTTRRRRTRWLVSAVVPLSRSGRHAAAERNVVVSLFAPVRLDLRETQMTAGEASIVVVSLFAPVFVTLPEHVAVDSSVVPLLAPVHEQVSGDVPPQAPRVRLRGVSLCGPIFVQSRRR
ncbi:MAG: DUF1707 domain-containing protein [Gaiellaceae bacterium]